LSRRAPRAAAGAVGLAADRSAKRGGPTPSRPRRHSTRSQTVGDLTPWLVQGEPTVSRSGGPCGPPARGGGLLSVPAVARTADARRSGRARARPDPRAARGALARLGCARLRGRPVSRAQRGPRRSLQDGHDSQAGSGADGLRDVPARILSERRLYAAFLPRGPFPGGVSLHRTERSEGGSRGHDSRSGLAWPVPAGDQVCINAARAFQAAD
jgi:hypothetical protein